LLAFGASISALMLDRERRRFLVFETKSLTLAEAKLDGDGPGRLSGYASVWDGVDSYGDTIVKGAYKDTISDFLRDGFIPWGHDWSGYPVATPDKAKEDDHGLWIEAVFHTDPESQRARQLVAERLERGKSMGLSIGYQAKGFDFQEIDGHQVRRLLDIDLMEVSLVMVPADSAARVAGVKGRRRLSRGQLEAVITTLQALLGEDEADELAEAASEAPADAGDGKGLSPLGVVDAYVAGLSDADDAAVLDERQRIEALLAETRSAGATLDALLKRVDDIGREDPRELFRQFRRISGLYGPIHGGRRAG
jgi:HK97 family phage prohead protease